MIDWPQVLANAVWIVGAALALATFSYASWLASLRKEHLRDTLRQATLQLLLRVAAVLFCLGLGLTANSLLETALWLALAVFSAISGIACWRTLHSTRKL
jgi:succinate dehydrogenase hydrophobic anchor subunit